MYGRRVRKAWFQSVRALTGSTRTGFCFNTRRGICPRTGGVLVFQLADSLRSSALLKLRAKLALRSRMQSFLGGGKPYSMEMHCISEADIRKLVHASGARVVDVCLTNSADPSFCGDLQYVTREPESGYVSKQYCVVKAA